MIEVYKDGEKLNKSRVNIWLGKRQQKFAIKKMHEAGYSSSEIARVLGISEIVVNRHLNDEINISL